MFAVVVCGGPRRRGAAWRQLRPVELDRLDHPRPERNQAFAAPYLSIEHGALVLEDLERRDDRGIAFSLSERSLVEAGKYLYSRFRTTKLVASPCVPDDVLELVSAGASLAATDPFLAA